VLVGGCRAHGHRSLNVAKIRNHINESDGELAFDLGMGVRAKFRFQLASGRCRRQPRKD